MKYDVIFESERIYFVKLTESLINDYLNMINDIEVQKYVSNNRKTYTFDEELDWVKRKINNSNTIFSMIEKGTNNFIGNIDIMDIHDNTGELGIAITGKMQNNHFGQESLKRIIDYAFNELSLNSLYLNVFNFNPRAIHCYEKVGFIKDGKGKNENDIHMKIEKHI